MDSRSRLQCVNFVVCFCFHVNSCKNEKQPITEKEPTLNWWPPFFIYANGKIDLREFITLLTYQT